MIPTMLYHGYLAVLPICGGCTSLSKQLKIYEHFSMSPSLVLKEAEVATNSLAKFEEMSHIVDLLCDSPVFLFSCTLCYICFIQIVILFSLLIQGGRLCILFLY